MFKIKNPIIVGKGVEPSGTKEITSNGTHDVAEFKSANVNVQAGYSYPELESITMGQHLAKTVWLIINTYSSGMSPQYYGGGWSGDFGYYYDNTYTKKTLYGAEVNDDMGGTVNIIGDLSSALVNGNILAFEFGPKYDFDYDPGYDAYIHGSNAESLVEWLKANAILIGYLA